MNEAEVVRFLKAGGELSGHARGARRCQRCFGVDDPIERGAIHVIHHEEVLAVARTHFMDGHDVWMAQTRRGSRFNFETPNQFIASE